MENESTTRSSNRVERKAEGNNFKLRDTPPKLYPEFKQSDYNYSPMGVFWQIRGMRYIFDIEGNTRVYYPEENSFQIRSMELAEILKFTQALARQTVNNPYRADRSYLVDFLRKIEKLDTD
jgi:hypothetical protein